MIEESLLSFWPLEGGIQGIGNASLLDQPLTAFFASRQCSGAAIRAAMAWAIEQARSKSPVISGFHSPLEQSVLEVLLTAEAPWVLVVARKPEQTHLRPALLQAANAGRAAIISINDSTRRLSADMAMRRNEWVAAHAAKIVIAHASPMGELQRQVTQWQREGQCIHHLVDGHSGISTC